MPTIPVFPIPGIFRRRPYSGAGQLVSLTTLNLWRRYPYEPTSRAVVRGSVFMVAILILLAYTVYTIAHALDPTTLYGIRTFRQTRTDGFTPQPHLFTNHCTSAMAPGADQNAFASLISVQQHCDNGISFGAGIQQIANCNPVWYLVSGYARDVNIFIEFYGEDGSAEGTTATDTCLAFECPPCRDQSKNLYWYDTYVSLSFPPIVPTNGSSLWLPAVANHIGSTAIWPWNNASNANNGKDLNTGESRCMPVDIRNTPFIAQNGSHYVAAMTYSESSFSVSGTFSDFIGLPNRYTTTSTYGASKIGISRQSSDTLQGDSSFIMRRAAWNNWDSTQDYTASTLPAVIGSLGGLWSAFGGVLAGIFGTSMAFIVFGSKPIGIKPLITLGKREAARRLDDFYLQPGRPVDAEARLRAVSAYMADLLVDTGELDLTLGRTPNEDTDKYDLDIMNTDSEVEPAQYEDSPMPS